LEAKEFPCKIEEKEKLTDNPRSGHLMTVGR